MCLQGRTGRRIPAAFLILFVSVSTICAAETDPPPGQTFSHPVLAPVPVVGIPADRASGKSILEGEILHALPGGNGSINELLERIPDVQLSEKARSASRAGEILPPPISISGGKGFQNTFRLDAFDINSFLDPSGTKPAEIYNDVPGHSQEIFLQTRLVDRLTVFDSNIPARYGGFTGGVVIAESLDPGPTLGGSLFYRTSREGWTNFHQTTPGRENPDFQKYEAGLELRVPLSEESSLVGSYQQLASSFPVSHLGSTREQSRRLETYFLKGKQILPAGELEFSLLSTPYTGKYFLKNTKDSDFTIKGGGWRSGGEYLHFFKAGEFRLKAGYGRSTNTREAPNTLRQWATTDNHFWGRSVHSGVSYQGGFGDLEKEQESFSLGGVFEAEPFGAGNFEHVLEAGFDLQHIRGRFSRSEEAVVYLGADLLPTVICGEDGFACSDGEQFFTSREIYAATTVEADLRLLDLYIEDRLQYRRLTFRPGLRLSHDDLSSGWHAAPRLTAALDLFGEGQTVLIGGFNRYYARPLMTFKLREAQVPPRVEYRSADANFVQDWVPSPFPGGTVTRFSGLDLPHTDETTIGLDQELFGGRIILKYVHRQGQDEYARRLGAVREDGLRTFTLTNDGKSRHNSVRISWERHWRHHYLSFAGNWQETSGSAEDYDDILENENLSRRVWLGNHLIYRSALPREDFNRTWTANLNWRYLLPRGFSFVNSARYRSGYRQVVNTGETRAVPDSERQTNPLTGEPIFESVPVYKEADLDDAFVFDWTLAWQSSGSVPLRLTLEIYNVFDEKLETGVNEMEVGRQFWAGAEVRF